ncbi:replication initiation factor domain-containing protein [Priestia aryabhattai]|uniref:replication initiation factor domain-containing protein n=1 Tax=Priestia aryabhattai TaxID=412384 RepID=UPI003D2E8D19
MKDTRILIDRLTIIAYDNGRFTNYLKNSGYVDIDYYTKKTFGFKQAYRGLHGESIQVDDKSKVRVDFNPNTSNLEEIKHILSYLKYPHLTRLDVAIDYFNMDFQNIDWSCMRARKRNYWTDKYGTLETLYIGSPTSDKRFRIYNKALEMKEKEKEDEAENHVEKWWRVEVQQRFKSNDIYSSKEYFLPNLFDIRPYKKRPDISFIDKFSERMVLAGLLERPEELRKADKKTRAKYKKLLEEVRKRAGIALENPPHEIYEKEKSLLANQLTDLFSQCARLTAFKEAI